MKIFLQVMFFGFTFHIFTEKAISLRVLTRVENHGLQIFGAAVCGCSSGNHIENKQIPFQDGQEMRGARFLSTIR